MAISKIKFGECKEGVVYAYTLTNKNGMTAEILNYGGIIRKLVYKNIDVVLGRDTMEEYLDNEGYFAALIGRFQGDKTGIAMEIYTDLCGVQVYSGNMIEEGRVCKDGAVYSVHDGMCFETQVFPNNLKFSHFPDAILRKGEKYDTVTSYKFI